MGAERGTGGSIRGLARILFPNPIALLALNPWMQEPFVITDRAEARTLALNVHYVVLGRKAWRKPATDPTGLQGALLN